MAISRDSKEYNYSLGECFTTLLALLPALHVRIEPLFSSPLNIEDQNHEKKEIRARSVPAPGSPTEPAQTSQSTHYRYKFNLEPKGEDSCLVKAESSTAGVTDAGLGQLVLRQMLITLSLALGGKLPPGALPVFFVELPLPPAGSIQAGVYDRVNRGFQLVKRGQADDTLREWDSALSLDPACVEAHFHRGVLLMLLEDLEAARQSFEKTIQLDPQHLLARLYLDDTVYRLKKKARQAPPPNVPAKPLAEESPTKRSLPSGQLPGTGQVPGGGHNPVNEEELPTQAIKREFNGRLLLKGAGTPVAEYELKQAIVTLGRQEDNTLMLLDGKVSRHHTRINTSGSVSVLEDLNSANGTYYNGRRMYSGEKVTLHSGDIIKLGAVEITYINPLQPPPTTPPVRATASIPPMPVYPTGPQKPPPTPQEVTWAMQIFGFNPMQPVSPATIESQFNALRLYWEGRLREAPTVQLQQEARIRLQEVIRAHQLLT